ncbi:hypothetical protein BCR33DRAFT_208452 [Rhizoclosmatium globosum]|uniref:Ankyrin n=1 Tax=Rhizoclosmatium globosum TaxID=329046 RepID=A0A1Y2CD58_9FUNG|nr:hypothetical protein BCR33DRAFT_208452 [Rhizoclosmatium globosum]|eukprot:ORY44754.1 hypothetical protein BCR33DRAFT_208452 [Rhizoclosmatium globosum]
MEEEERSPPPKPTLTTLPYEILAMILRKLTIQRRVSVLSSNKYLYTSQSLHSELIFRERPFRFEYLAASGNTAHLLLHHGQVVTRLNECTECSRDTLALLPYLNSKLYSIAARNGMLEFMVLLRKLHPGVALSRGMIDDAAEGGHLEVIQALVGGDSRLCVDSLVGGGGGGQERILDWRGFTKGNALSRAAAEGHLETVQWVLEHSVGLVSVDEDRERRKVVLREAVDLAAGNGHLEVVEWVVGVWVRDMGDVVVGSTGIGVQEGKKKPTAVPVVPYEERNLPCTSKALDMAAKNGHFPVVQYLHKVLQAPCTKAAMDQAAGHGHLEIVQFLHRYRNEGGTAKGMDFACLRNHLSVVKWLHENRKEGCTIDALNYAASRGNLKIVQFLVKCRREGKVSDAIKFSQKGGHSAVTGFLLDCEKRGSSANGKGRR